MLCIERLSHGINEAVQEGRWKPINLARQGIPISHFYLFFADDLLLLAEASITQAQVIKNVINTFCMSSGEKVNNSKTSTFFSHNVHTVDVKKIGDKLGFTTMKDLGTYLGMSLLHKRISKQTYQSLIDRVQQRLSGWTAKHLSLAGRITLTQSVIQALPIFPCRLSYYLQVFVIK